MKTATEDVTLFVIDGWNPRIPAWDGFAIRSIPQIGRYGCDVFRLMRFTASSVIEGNNT